MGIYKRGKIWQYQISINGRRINRSLGTTSKRDAEAMFAEVERRARLARLGLRDPRLPYFPIAEHLEDYGKHLQAKGVRERHRQDTLRNLRRFVEHQNIRIAAELTRERAEAFMVAERSRTKLGRPNQKTAETQKVSVRTVNRIRELLRAFGRWLYESNRLTDRPFKGLPKMRDREGRRIVRRALTTDEIARLLAAAPQARAAVYLTAVTTGLRRRELSDLKLHHLALDDPGDAWAHLPGELTKNGKPASVALPAETVQALKELEANRDQLLREAKAWARRRQGKRDGYVFPGGVPNIKTYRRDLDAAGIPYETDAGRVDFHALRGTFCTMLAKAGVPLTTAQKMMRHCDPALTANFYTSTLQADHQRAVASLPIDSFVQPEHVAPSAKVVKFRIVEQDEQGELGADVREAAS